MKKETIFYEAPTAQTFVVRLEGTILTGSANAQSSSMPSFTLDDEEDW